MPSLVKAVVGLSVLGQVFASPLTLKHSHAHKRDTCATGVHIIVGAPASYPAQLGLLSTLVSSIQSNITGSDYWITPYDQGTYPAKDATPVMQQAVANYTSQCPDTPIVLVGYSRGGIVVMNALCEGLDTKYMSNVIAATSYGEETYLAGQSYDVGTCKVDAPTYPRAQPTGCGLWSSVIKSWCNWDDEACCATGTTIDPHFTYGSLYDYTATSWIMDQWKAWKSQHGHGVPKPTTSKITTSSSKVTTSSKATTTSKVTTTTSAKPTTTMKTTTKPTSSAKSTSTIPSKTTTCDPAKKTSAPSEGGNGWHPSGQEPQWPGPQPQWSGSNWSNYWKLWQEWLVKYKAWWSYNHGW